MNMKTQSRGFTLLEMVIVLTILGLLLAGILGPIATRYEQKQRQDTQDQLEQIKDALYGFSITNGRLPCPDTDTPPDGIENPVGGGTDCGGTYVGTVPYETLGVNAIVDSWNNPFIYRVTGEWADSIDGTTCAGEPAVPTLATVGESLELCSIGDIDIINVAGISIVNDVPVIVFSGGKNDFGSTPENDNTDRDEDFVYSDIHMVAGEEYDDMMVWISPNILKYRMVQAGRLP